ncbi:MAG TPA: hypothetical protein PKH79_00585 [Prolixibacteraceae bacterium]|nr:hypothetical protein [Prolixibacteraceae bacterium]
MKFRTAIRIMSFMILGGLILPIAFSCKERTSKAPELTNKSIQQDIKEYAYPVHSVFDITNMLIQIDASYVIGITNNPLNVEKYFSDQSKAYNLGIYTADLAYATTYNEKAEVQNYFNASEKLITDLSLASALSSDLPEQIEENIDNKEKLVEIITKVTQDAYSYLNNQGRAELAYLILAGSVIEGLYLTCHLSESTYQNPEIVKTILYQKEPLQKLQALMESGNIELTQPVLNDIKKINAIFAEAEEPASLTIQQVDQLTGLLSQIREKNNQ